MPPNPVSAVPSFRASSRAVPASGKRSARRRLEREHRVLERLLEAHQVALVTGNRSRAAHYLHRYRDLLTSHLHVEEPFLAAADEGIRSTRWPVTTYRAEHRKLLALLDRLLIRFESLSRDSLDPLQLIALIEQEKVLKGVAEHHHQREEQDLYPALPRRAQGDP